MNPPNQRDNQDDPLATNLSSNPSLSRPFFTWAPSLRFTVTLAILIPIAFKHQVHAEAEVGCLFCHPNTLQSDISGIPSVARCVGCHQTIALDSPDVKLVLDYWERNEPIPWQILTYLGSLTP